MGHNAVEVALEEEGTTTVTLAPADTTLLETSADLARGNATHGVVSGVAECPVVNGHDRLQQGVGDGASDGAASPSRHLSGGSGGAGGALRQEAYGGGVRVEDERGRNLCIKTSKIKMEETIFKF
jgi:hypothetical protein